MIVVLLLITIVGSILATWLLPKAFKSAPPYGALVDIGVGTIAGIIFSLVAFTIIAPAIGLTGLLALLLCAGDAIGGAAVMLWVLRRIKG